jgi:long-chain acyl-CoA synthetase
MVAIISENRIEWLFADLATIAAGLPNVVLSPRLSDAALFSILAHCAARAAFVENETGAKRLSILKGRLPSLEHVIVMDALRPSPDGALPFERLLQMGERQDDGRLAAILKAVAPDDLATIIYTSGSTGEPKGVMRTQRNLMANITSGRAIALSKPEELVALILSLNHLLGRYGFHKSAATGRTTALVEATELEVDLKTIQSLAPTSMSLVPRVLERMCETVLAQPHNRLAWDELEALDQQKRFGRILTAEEATRDTALRSALKTAFMNAFGARVKYLTYSGAPMPSRLMRLFELIGIPLLGSYGSTECGGVTLSALGESRPGNLGKPLPNVDVAIAVDGEILVRGPTVTPGYFGDERATREGLDAEGWFHTGDLGMIEADGSLRMVGRKKDVFYCADGSNIYPRRIELSLENDPFIRQAVLVGDCRPFLAALLVPERSEIAARMNKNVSVLTEQEVMRLLEASVARVNAALEEHEKIRKFVILGREFPDDVRSVTPTAKIKVDRRAVAELYNQQIEAIYHSRDHQTVAPQLPGTER